jgi:hypothetical protein
VRMEGWKRRRLRRRMGVTMGGRRGLMWNI